MRGMRGGRGYVTKSGDWHHLDTLRGTKTAWFEHAEPKRLALLGDAALLDEGCHFGGEL